MINKNDVIFKHLKDFASLNDRDLNDSQPFWKARKMNKSDFFNMEQMVCNYLGLVIKGIFRVYYHEPDTKEDKNIYFFSENQFVVSLRNVVSQNACWYFIEAMEDAEIFFISHKDLNGLYKTHSNWVRFGRLLAESLFEMAQKRTEEFIFFTNEQRYARLLKHHPHIVGRIPAYHLSSYLGITNPSLSRIRKRIEGKRTG